MGARGKGAQTRHDRKVEERASSLRERGFRVQADLPGHVRPPTLAGHRPDIFARRGGELVVEEIETPSTLRADRAQQEALRRSTEELGGRFAVRLARP